MSVLTRMREGFRPVFKSANEAERIFACDRCGALVASGDVDRHREWDEQIASR